ncbi:MAG: AarF/ABC1/UbiB kinase family protein [Actinobacteria bacterium]|nr:AarF/ABC1/UbiB kinase family protein [Actinomycetota bacterium]
MHRRQGFLTRVRNLETVRHVSEVAIRHGFGYFFESHNLWDLVPGRKRRPAPMPSQLGRHVREMLEELGPTYVKFGQVLSTRPDLLPDEVVQELVKLQDRVPPFGFATVREVIEQDFRLSVERIFESIDEEPLASASIGQVHKAVLPGGAPVVVKVQRPAVRELIRRDIDLFYQLAGILARRIGDDLPVDPLLLVDEFAAAISRETDYLLEARNAARIARNLAADEEFTIPSVHQRLCSQRVITLDFLPGPTLNCINLEELDWSERKRLAQRLTELWFKMVLRDGFFHGDPHPANVVVMDDGRLGLLDFGSAGALGPEDLQEGTRLFRHIVDQDLRGVKRALRRLGLRWNSRQEAQLTEAIEGLFNRYFGLRLSDIDSGTVVRDIFEIAYKLRLRFPARFLLLERAVITLEGVVAQVYPDFNVFDAARPYAQRLVMQKSLPSALAARLSRSAQDYAEAFENYPLQLRDVLDLMTRGDLRINFNHTGLENFIHRMDLITNRLVMAVVATALALASAILGAFVENGPQILGVSIWGIPGFLVALFFGVWLMWAIFRSGRL